MSNLPDDELDAILEKHFSDQLDGQLGRANRAFESHLHRSTRPARTMWKLSIGAAVTGAIAASVVFVARTIAPAPIMNQSITRNTPAAPLPGSLEEVTWSRTLDEGTVFLDAQTPAKKVIRQRVQKLIWTDPAGGDQIEASFPHEDVMLIGLEAF